MLAGLSIFQHQKLKAVTRGIELQAAANEEGTAAVGREDVPVQPVPAGADDITALKAELASMEQKLDAANSEFYDEMAAETEQ